MKSLNGRILQEKIISNSLELSEAALLRTLHGAFANRLRPGDVVYVPSSTNRSGNRIQRDVRYWQDWLSMSRNGIRENPNTLIDEGGMNAPYREGGSHHISM